MSRAQACRGGGRLEVAGEGLAGQVPGLAVGREEPRSRRPALLLQQRQIGARRRPRRFGQRHETLAAALAADDKDAILGQRRRLRQGDQFRDAQAARVEKLEEAVHARAAQPLRRRGVGVLGGLLGHAQEPVDMIDGQDLGQGAPALRPLDGGGRVRRRIAFRIEELVELTDRGQAPRRRRCFQAALVEARHEGADRRRSRRQRADLRLGEEGEVIVEVAPIRLQGVGGGAALGGQHVEEQCAEPLRRRVHRGCSFEAGMLTVISRGSGSTSVASANMAAKARPAMTARTARKRKRVGMDGPARPSIIGQTAGSRQDLATL